MGIKLSKVRNNPELNKCPYCGESIAKGSSCPKCGKDFAEVNYVDLIQESLGDDDMIGAINAVISDRNKDILNMAEITTSVVTKKNNSTGEKVKFSFIKNARLYYIDLEEERNYSCKFEQLVKYEEVDADRSGNHLIKDWLREHKCRKSLFTLRYKADNNKKRIDTYVLYYIHDEKDDQLLQIGEKTGISISQELGFMENGVCPACGTYIKEKSKKCPKCARGFGDICYMEYSWKGNDNETFLECVNQFLSDESKDIIDVRLKSVAMPGEVRNSFVKSAKICYVQLYKKRKYVCRFEQILQYRKVHSNKEVSMLLEDWHEQHDCRKIVSVYSFPGDGASKFVDVYALCFTEGNSNQKQKKAEAANLVQNENSGANDDFGKITFEKEEKTLIIDDDKSADAAKTKAGNSDTEESSKAVTENSVKTKSGDSDKEESAKPEALNSDTEESAKSEAENSPEEVVSKASDTWIAANSESEIAADEEKTIITDSFASIIEPYENNSSKAETVNSVKTKAGNSDKEESVKAITVNLAKSEAENSPEEVASKASDTWAAEKSEFEIAADEEKTIITDSVASQIAADEEKTIITDSFASATKPDENKTIIPSRKEHFGINFDEEDDERTIIGTAVNPNGSGSKMTKIMIRKVDKERIELANRLYQERDFERALTIYMRFAENDPDCAIKLGRMFKEGKGTRRDYRKALYWYRKAIPSAKAEPYSRIAEILDFGSPDVINPSEAAKFYRLAGELGDINAWKRLSEMYAEGIGVEKDMKLSAAYANKWRDMLSGGWKR